VQNLELVIKVTGVTTNTDTMPQRQDDFKPSTDSVQYI